MKIFNLKENKVIIDPEILTIPEFKKIWENDKSKTKINAILEFTYIYHICDSDSPYSNFSDDKKKSHLGLDLFNDAKYKPNKVIEEAANKYLELKETPLQRLLKAAQNKIDDIVTYLNNTPYSEDSAKTINDIYKNISSYVAQEEKLKSAVEKEKMGEGSKRKAGRRTGLFEE